MWWVLLFLVVGIFVLIRYIGKIIYVIVVMLCRYGLFYKNLDVFECKKKKEYCCIFINMKMRVF